MDLELKRKIVEQLKLKAPLYRCCVCGINNFVIVDGISNQKVVPAITSSKYTTNEETVPMAMLCCDNCGLVMMFSLGVLGLLPANVKVHKSEQ